MTTNVATVVADNEAAAKTAMVNPGQLVVIDREMQGAGAASWWTLHGDIDLARLTTAWADAGLPMDWLPVAPSADTALRRALDWLTSQGGSDKDVVYVKSTRELAVVVNFEDNGFPQQKTGGKWILNKVQRPQMSFAANDKWSSMHDAVVRQFDVESSRISNGDASVWLRRIADRVHATSLRPTGGFYFVPPQHLPTWERVNTALRAATGHVIYRIPAMRGEAAVEAVLAAITAEAEKAIEDLTACTTDPKMRARTLGDRATEAETMTERLATYEAALGVKLTALTDRLTGLKVALFDAKAAAESRAA